MQAAVDVGIGSPALKISAQPELVSADRASLFLQRICSQNSLESCKPTSDLCERRLAWYPPLYREMMRCEWGKFTEHECPEQPQAEQRQGRRFRNGRLPR